LLAREAADSLTVPLDEIRQFQVHLPAVPVLDVSNR